MPLSENTKNTIKGYFSSNSSLSLMGAAENQPPGKKKYYFKKAFQLDSQKFSYLMDELHANNPCGSEQSFIHLLRSINLIKNNGEMWANGSGETTTALDFYFKQRGPEESHTEIAECIRKSPKIAKIISNELNEEDQREYDRLKNANNKKDFLLSLHHQMMKMPVIGVFVTMYYLYIEISNAFQDIANRKGDVLLCAGALSPAAEWEFIRRKITVITRISDKTGIGFSISCLADNVNTARSRITAADNVYASLCSLDFPAETQETAFSLIPSDLCSEIDGYLSNNGFSRFRCGNSLHGNGNYSFFS